MSKESRLVLAVVTVLIALVIVSCGKDEPPPTSSNVYGNAVLLRPFNLPTLEDDSKICYELWLVDFEYSRDSDSNEIRIVNDEISLGKFYWNSNRYEFNNLTGGALDSVFETPDKRNVYDFNTIMITLEPLEDDVRSNNGVIFDDIEFGQPIRGQFDFVNRQARDVVYETEFTMKADYVLRSYSDDGSPLDDPLTGLWFHDVTGTPPNQRLVKTLTMPVLTDKANISYEGWIEYPGVLPHPISTGKFKNPHYKDWNNQFAGSYAFPNLPGEDFVAHEPAGLDFPLTLVGDGMVYITIEPYPDPDPDERFPLTIFSSPLPVSTPLHSSRFPMENRYGFLPGFNAVVMEL